MENSKDVRRPNRIFRFKPTYTINGNGEKQPSNLEDPLPEYMHFIGMLFSMFGLMMKHKFCAWCAVLCSLVGFANSRASDDGKQVLSSFMLSIAAIVMCYVQNPAPMSLPWA